MKYLTITNYGMIEFCKNAIQSFKNISNETIHVGCLDEQSKNELDNIDNVSSVLINYVPCPSNHEKWSTVNFRKITQNKFPFILSFLEKENDILYFDNDVSFKKNPTDYLKLNENEIMIQSDLPGTMYCTGFVFFKNTKNTIELINKTIKKNNTEQNKKNYKMGDQLSFIHEANIFLKKHKNILTVLPSELFPNGDKLIKNKYDKEHMYIGHANYVIGKENKKKLLLEKNLWFLK